VRGDWEGGYGGMSVDRLNGSRQRSEQERAKVEGRPAIWR
jgi:hypothetical protein